MAQVVAYAEALDCRRAYLIYPTANIAPFVTSVGSIKVRSLCLDLQGHLEHAGSHLLAELLTDVF